MSFVHVFDAFVDSIVLKSSVFYHMVCHCKSCPPYHTAAFMRLHLHGYRYTIAQHEKLKGRAIDRSEFAGALGENTKRVNQNPDCYRKLCILIYRKVCTVIYRLQKASFCILSNYRLHLVSYRI